MCTNGVMTSSKTISPYTCQSKINLTIQNHFSPTANTQVLTPSATCIHVSPIWQHQNLNEISSESDSDSEPKKISQSYFKPNPSTTKKMSFSNPIISSFSSTLIRRTIPFCSSTTSTTCATSTQFLLSLKTKPIWPQPRAIHDPPDQYQTWSPPEFSPPVPGHYDNPSAPPEMPRISTSPDVDPISIPPPEVNPYHPPLDRDPNPCPDFPVPPLKPPPVPDIPPPFLTRFQNPTQCHRNHLILCLRCRGPRLYRHPQLGRGGANYCVD